MIVHPDMRDAVPETAVAIVVGRSPGRLVTVAALFHPLPPAVPGIHPSAVVAATARIDPSAEIGPLAVIGENVVIGARGRIGPLALIGDGVVIGREVRIGPHASRLPCADRRPGLYLPGRPDRTGWVRLRYHARTGSTPCRSLDAW